MSERLYGILAEFATAEALLQAARRARAAGWESLEAYSPFTIEGLAEAVGAPRHRVALTTLIGGIVGGLGGYFMQWYAAVISYPINVGGRPLHSWPSFIPVTFEMTVLGAALAAVFGMFMANGLPRLHHPLFAMPEFDLATRNRFFLCICARNPGFDAERAQAFLRKLDPLKLSEVPA
jgi:ActD protein